MRFCKKRKANRDKKRKKYFLDNYGAYGNADELTHEKMLEIFWKMLKKRRYDITNFNSNTRARELAKQNDGDWDDLGNIA